MIANKRGLQAQVYAADSARLRPPVDPCDLLFIVLVFGSHVLGRFLDLEGQRKRTVANYYSTQETWR